MAYLLSTAIPKLRTSIAGDTMPLELSEAFIGHLESLMLAQAQECVWQRAVMGTSFYFFVPRSFRKSGVHLTRRLKTATRTA